MPKNKPATPYEALKYKSKLQGIKIKELDEVNRILNDKVQMYRNAFERANKDLSERRKVVSNVTQSLLCDTVIDNLRSTKANGEWRKYILQNFA